MSLLRQPAVLMCPPDFYGIEYEINPWMHRDRPSNRENAAAQWKALYELLKSLGVEVHLLEPQPGWPDLVFTANAGMICRSTVFLASFRHPARQGETPIDAAWFASHGFNTITLPPGMFFEGAGDALFCGDTLFGGYLIRSDAGALHWLGAQMGCRVLPLQLVDSRFYHLDTCFCPLDPQTAIWYPPAFDVYARQALAAVPRLIPVREEGSGAVRLQRCRDLPRRGAEFGLPAIGSGSAGGGIYAAQHAAGRVSQIGRERQMPDPETRW